MSSRTAVRDLVTSSNKILNNTRHLFITPSLTSTEKKSWEHVQTVLCVWRLFLGPSQGKISSLSFCYISGWGLDWELLMYSHFLKYNLNFWTKKPTGVKWSWSVMAKLVLVGFLFWYVVSLLSGFLYPHICQQHSLWFLLMCPSCLSLLWPLRFPPNCRPCARKVCAITEGLAILSLCLPGPPRFGATARCTSPVGSAKKVVVVPSFSTSCEIQVLGFFEAGKGGEVIIIITFLCFSSQSLLVTPE